MKGRIEMNGTCREIGLEELTAILAHLEPSQKPVVQPASCTFGAIRLPEDASELEEAVWNVAVMRSHGRSKAAMH